jgi:uncharacterized protein (TIGR02001 family)
MRPLARLLGFLIAITGIDVALMSSALAQMTMSGSIGATSDFVFRGLSYSRSDAALQASVDFAFSPGLALGAFTSSVNPNPGRSPNAEFDFWAAYTRSVNDWLAADFRYTHYMYPDDPRVADYDRDEFTATLALRESAFISVSFSPNTEAIASTPGFSEGDTWSLELSGRHALSERWAISAGVGRYFLDEIYGIDYDYWSATLSADFAPVELHLAVLGSDDTAERIFTSRNAGERVAATILYRFGTQ